ncbi:hypothetical protein [Pseudorhodoplanes sp.]|uniref:hypothetical protein n=1 Tax=Pseudorhodoplanes sp. TaxID=1934341 RepID=UPI00391C676B
MRTVMDLQWWITVIGVPLVGALFWLRFHDRNETDAALRALKDELANYKLLVATSFVTATSMKELEGRIMSHLDKIEKKIDRVIEQKHPPA